MIRLLGLPTVEIDGRTVTSFRSHRVPALLGFLAWKGKPCRREEIIDALWPDADEAQGRHNLRQTVLYARQAVGTDAIDSQRESIRLTDAAQIDCQLFDSAVREQPRVAIETYRGRFLDGLYDDWIEEPRAQYSARVLDALIQIAEASLESDPHESLQMVVAALAEDEYNERAQAIRIRALRALGQPAAARREFDSFKAKLQSELTIQPSRIVEEALESPLEGRDVHTTLSAESAELRQIIASVAVSRKPSEAVELALGLIPHWVSTGRTAEGLEILNEVLDKVGGRVSGVVLRRAEVGRARLYTHLGALATAEAALDAVLPNLDDSLDRVRAKILHARIAMIRYHPERSDGILAEAIKEAVELGLVEEELEARLLHGKGALYRRDFSGAIDELLQAAEVAKRQENDEFAADAFVFLTFAAARAGDVRSAEGFAERARLAIEPVQSIRSAHLRVQLARAYEEIGRLDLAEAGYRRGCDDYVQSQSDFWQAVCLTYLADLLESRGESERSIVEHEKALALRKPIGDALGIATSLRGIGRSQLSLGRAFLARDSFAESARLFRGEDAAPGYASALCGLGQAEARVGDSVRARKILRRAVDLLLGLPPAVKMEIGPTGAQWIEQARATLESIERIRERRGVLDVQVRVE